ncbi:artemin [Megalops cyprinoides]|uniref:artemin n=1 Tax=Megalops cyprinoides TaxID=118141 RepID=UPI001863F962|nr:artemin [Megalops cyprinoides]
MALLVWSPQVMLWMLSSLLALVDGAFPGESRRAEPSPVVGRVQDEVGWHPTNIPEVEELEEGGNIQSSWDGSYENPSISEEVEDHQSRWVRSSSSSGTPKSQRTNRRKSKDCRIQKKEMRIRDLGLGFDSDEIVLFKYCVGTCEDSRKNYDLALKALMKSGNISGKRVSTRPCCRPTRYEAVSFMDAKTVWQTIELLSAANCSCVG